MSALKAVGKPGQEEDVAQVHRIRITLTSRNVKNLEKGTQQPSPRASAPTRQDRCPMHYCYVLDALLTCRYGCSVR